jgi:hypothetical protein
MTTAIKAEAQTPETTDLERPVLAHERILEAFIAYMSRADPALHRSSQRAPRRADIHGGA